MFTDFKTLTFIAAKLNWFTATACSNLQTTSLLLRIRVTGCKLEVTGYKSGMQYQFLYLPILIHQNIFS